MKVMNQSFGLDRFRLEEAVISRLLDGGMEERTLVMDIYTGIVINYSTCGRGGPFRSSGRRNPERAFRPQVQEVAYRLGPLPLGYH